MTGPRYTVDVLEMPRDEDGDGVADGTLRFTEVALYVLDIGGGLDGILGMNLPNPANLFVYDPFDSLEHSVTMAFARAMPSTF